MKPHARIRKTVKWGGAAVCVLLIAAWAASCWWYVWGIGNGWAVFIGAGRVSLGDIRSEPAVKTGWSLAPMPGFAMKWGFGWPARGSGSLSFIAVPMWVFAGPILVATAAAWRRDAMVRARQRANQCVKCGYAKTGLAPGVVCPECGASAG